MDNQHKLIKGYRELSQGEIDLMNEIKAKASEVEALVALVASNIEKQYDDLYTEGYADDSAEGIRLEKAEPYNWMQDAKKELQTAFMKLVRSVAQPTTF